LGARKGKRERSKAMTIILLPMLIVIFFIGWVMYWVGNEKRGDKMQRKSPTQRKQPEQDNVTFMPIIFEEPEEIANS
jgi:flagellar basal body-associated protein FliL